jgi:hypothetical protein
MKKILVLSFAIAMFIGVSSAFATGNLNLAGGSVKIINDSDGDVQIHTGSGFVEINRTQSTSVSCEPGKVISLAEKGKKKGPLFTIEESMCGKVVKLSKYL